MITKNQLRKVNKLYEDLKELSLIKDSLESPHVKTSVGLVDINSAAPKDVVPSRNSRYFYNHFKEETGELNTIFKGMIDRAIKKKEIEISEFIVEEPK